MSNIVPIEQAQQLELRKEEARILSASALMPKEFQGERGRANCLIAIEMANRIGANPLMVAQNLNIIHGKPSWSSTFMISSVNASGRFSKPLRYEERGEPGKDDWGMRAFTFDKDGDRVDGPWVDLAMAKAEGWSTKSGSKWKTMPELMLRYRSAAFFARTICPELTMGLLTSDEMVDLQPVVIEATSSQNALEQALGLDEPTESEPTEEVTPVLPEVDEDGVIVEDENV